MNTFFTSDTHFYHKNSIEYCNRPFKDVEEMNEGLIANWNSVVGDDDQIFHLGDFSFAGPEKTEEVVARLKGKKHLIRGNHDHKNVLKKIEPYFVWVKDVYMLTVQDINPYAPTQNMSVYKGKNQMIWLAHYAHRVWPQQHYGVWHLFGHSHGMLPEDPRNLCVDVGVDCFKMKPVSYEELKEIMTKKTWKPKETYS